MAAVSQTLMDFGRNHRQTSSPGVEVIVTSRYQIALMLSAYGFAAIESRPTLGNVVAALAAVAIGGSGLLYAWRPGAAGLVD